MLVLLYADCVLLRVMPCDGSLVCATDTVCDCHNSQSVIVPRFAARRDASRVYCVRALCLGPLSSCLVVLLVTVLLVRVAILLDHRSPNLPACSRLVHSAWHTRLTKSQVASATSPACHFVAPPWPHVHVACAAHAMRHSPIVPPTATCPKAIHSPPRTLAAHT